MYNNIGQKIKHFATALFVIGTICSTLTGFYIVMFLHLEMAAVGILVIIIGSFLSWVSTFLLYGFGELIEKTTEIADNTKTYNYHSQEQLDTGFERLVKIEKLHSQGLITEDEYKKFRDLAIEEL
ncbi:MAG: hypothetical protein IJZ20_05575 [Clostridia bacterium]|nr:hypothetical protein [Clostridia bacterium]